MKNKYKPFFYEKKKASFSKIFLSALLCLLFLLFTACQIPTARQIIIEPLYAFVSFAFNSARDLFDATRMYKEPQKKKQTYTPLELPDKEVLFAESLENLSAISQEDPLADLRQTPTPSEYTRVAQWEYLDPNMNYELNYGEKKEQTITKVQLVPPVFEHADLFNDGAAILSAAFRYWNVPENQYHISRRIHPDMQDPDISFSELQSYAKENYPQFYAFTRINGDKNTLIELLQAEIPPVIRVRRKLNYPFWLKDDRFSAAYLLINGYDSVSDTFSYQDTSKGNNLSVSAETLMADWYPFQRTYLVLYPEEKDQDVKDILSENYYEELNLQRALAKFRMDSDLLPDNAFAQYNYAVTLHKSGKADEAWEYYLRSVEISLPQRYLNYQSEIFENALSLGYADDMDELIDPVLRKNRHDEVLIVYSGWADILRGDRKSAGEKLEKAKKINPDNELVLYALKYKETMLP